MQYLMFENVYDGVLRKMGMISVDVLRLRVDRNGHTQAVALQEVDIDVLSVYDQFAV